MHWTKWGLELCDWCIVRRMKKVALLGVDTVSAQPGLQSGKNNNRMCFEEGKGKFGGGDVLQHRCLGKGGGKGHKLSI